MCREYYYTAVYASARTEQGAQSLVGLIPEAFADSQRSELSLACELFYIAFCLIVHDCLNFDYSFQLQCSSGGWVRK